MEYLKMDFMKCKEKAEISKEDVIKKLAAEYEIDAAAFLNSILPTVTDEDYGRLFVWLGLPGNPDFKKILYIQKYHGLEKARVIYRAWWDEETNRWGGVDRKVIFSPSQNIYNESQAWDVVYKHVWESIYHTPYDYGVMMQYFEEGEFKPSIEQEANNFFEKAENLFKEMFEKIKINLPVEKKVPPVLLSQVPKENFETVEVYRRKI
ncbi:MAG: hypothetical protein CH6_0053 [Candidatus Kapaibacterium sp.]|nr:MAG: hypothetical protein CH6_0053 [Candidatus Kapabacteria bacterium]